MEAKPSLTMGFLSLVTANRSMFNLHLGLPGIIPDLLHSVSQPGILMSEGLPQVLSRQLWREQFRGLINAKRKEAMVDVSAWRKIETAIASLSVHGTVAASQHSLLGGAEDCFWKQSVLPYTKNRIGRISDIFTDVPVTFHLTIQGQFDYLYEVVSRMPEGKGFPEPRITPSWAQLVRRIRTAAPRSRIVVWDFEHPEKVTLAFLISLLDTTDDKIIDALEKYLLNIPQPSKTLLSNHKITGISQSWIDKLDFQYERDLAEISCMENVSLILPENVPEEFHR
ncbi:hypothetical protein [Loktanella sp. R86503]|uniref:hypothetical protein n=1 Tax=Loktanella sp. R86503 TaxID=3093847 RepID=UPI0036DF2872